MLRAFASTSVVACVLSVCGATPARADYQPYGMPSHVFWMKTSGLSTAWLGYVDTARGAWNTSSGSYIKRNSTAAPTFTAGNYTAQAWYGLYSPGAVGGSRSFTIFVNTHTLKQDAGAKLYEWIISTSTHELGHALSLADNPQAARVSLMKHGRDRALVRKPTAYDVEEVGRYY